MASPVRIVFMGTPAFAVPSLKALVEAGFDVAAVVTQPDRPRGRGRAPAPSPVKAAAEELGIPVLQPAKIRKNDEFLNDLRAVAPEVIAVVAYGKILPKEVLDLPPLGCVNLHASLLPKYRGASPINHAIINGETETGATTMLMDAGMDTGDMLLEERVPIGPEETAEDLFKRLSVVGATLLARTIALVSEGKLEPRPQDDTKATYAPMLKKSDGRIDWSLSAEEIKNLARGLYPWPGTFTALEGGKTLKVHAVEVADPEDGPEAEPGTVVGVSDEGMDVRCGRGVVRLTEVQPENKKRMKAGDFVRGFRLSEGDRLG